MTTQTAMTLTSIVSLAAGWVACWFFTLPARNRRLQEAQQVDPKFFTESEQDLWIEYESRVDLARDDYNRKLARLKEVHDGELLDRAKIRHYRRLAEERKRNTKVTEVNNR